MDAKSFEYLSARLNHYKQLNEEVKQLNILKTNLEAGSLLSVYAYGSYLGVPESRAELLAAHLIKGIDESLAKIQKEMEVL